MLPAMQVKINSSGESLLTNLNRPNSNFVFEPGANLNTSVPCHTILCVMVYRHGEQDFICGIISRYLFVILISPEAAGLSHV